MSVICISIVQSKEQVIAGIPKTVKIYTNIPSLIFYTLDGTEPTIMSAQYVGPIQIPYNQQFGAYKSQLSVVLKVFASNGTDVSPVITEAYGTNIVDDNARLPHSPTTAEPQTSLQGLYPFGDNQIENGEFLNPADASITVDNPARPAKPTGFDGQGNPTGFTNKPYNLSNYDIVYSTQNAEGFQGPHTGNLLAEVYTPPDLNPPPSIGPEQTSQFTNTFDPRAFVIFQDFKNEDPNDPPQINRQFFSLEDPERARDGNYFFNSGLDSPAVSGSFLRSHYNPRTNEITYYYLDTWTNKWLISTAPFQPTGTFDGNMSSVFSAHRGVGSDKVFEWIPYRYRTLF